MLIINADDWGGWTSATDAALACWEARRITSVSAMVFMEDSERAAGIAREHGIDAGLHINLTQSFTGKTKAIPELVEAHSRISRFLRSSKYARLLYHPFLAGSFRQVFSAQLDEFVRLYGRRPSHYDGHQHFHLCTNMVLGRLLPAGERVRRSFSFSAGEKSAINRAYRGWVDCRLAARHRLTDHFFSLSQQLKWGQIHRVTQLAQSSMVELMTHPAWEEEYRFLTAEPCPVITRAYRDPRTHTINSPGQANPERKPYV
jgi:chitin disaccharide deacetylase